VEAHFDLLGRWLRKNGRPLALYTDRDSIFESSSKGQPDYSGQTQFGRALEELAVERITAYSPQAKGRVERLFGTLQDRWVKELRLAGVTTMAQANALLRRKLLREFNRRFGIAAARRQDAHRDLGGEHCLPRILCVQHQRSVSNDYTVRFRNRCFQLHPPAWPGLRGGKVTLEQRADGKLLIRFGDHYLSYHEIPSDPLAAARDTSLGAAPAPGVYRIHGRRLWEKTRARLTNQPSPQAYRRPLGARVALLRSPILPTVTRNLTQSQNIVQPRITPGGHFYSVETGDISTAF
jgi:hypothetical protein